jgi:putative spermidine/putrescine transport system permease protein
MGSNEVLLACAPVADGSHSASSTVEAGLIKHKVTLTIPGIGAGCLLCFILAIGYYITPALVGGASGTLISNQIAFHMKSTLDWSFASAMGLMLLAGVLAIYWVYNKLVGIDNIKLG